MMKDSIKDKDTKGMDKTLRTQNFENFSHAAYHARRGYAIRTNPATGEREMFVRGTTLKHFGLEHVQNFVEAGFFKSEDEEEDARITVAVAAMTDFSFWTRRKYADYLSKIAIENNVTVIYGHSRGAAVVDDMKVPGASKLGLDGGMPITRGKSKMLNYRQKNYFDRFIGGNAFEFGHDHHENNYHHVYRDKNFVRSKGSKYKSRRYR
jgi:hypothetical protein